jgi:YidC/Oxa1 family membrane protein insertase
MLDPLYEAFGNALAFFYAVVPNLGVAIILLTIAVMLVLFPLTAKSARSMLAMQRLQPEIKKLQAKHKGDRQKLNEEMMKLYQEHKVNPLGGCLPLLVQFPVFIALFHVLRNLSAVPEGSALFKAIEAAKPGGLEFLSMDLSLQATDNHGDILSAVPYYLLVGLVFFTGYLQSKQSQRNTPPGANPQMQMITRFLPLVLGVTSLFFPSGLVLYFFVSNLWRVGQQELIMRKIAPRDHLKAGRAIDAKSTVKDRPAKQKQVEEPGVDEEPAEEKPAVARKPAARPAPKTGRAEERPGPLGALRGLFQPPPPREETDGPAAGTTPPSKPAAAKQPAAKQPAAKQPAARGGSSRAGQSRRRRRRSSNKKRKR